MLIHLNKTCTWLQFCREHITYLNGYTMSQDSSHWIGLTMKLSLSWWFRLKGCTLECSNWQWSLFTDELNHVKSSGSNNIINFQGRPAASQFLNFIESKWVQLLWKQMKTAWQWKTGWILAIHRQCYQCFNQITVKLVLKLRCPIFILVR